VLKINGLSKNYYESLTCRSLPILQIISRLFSRLVKKLSKRSVLHNILIKDDNIPQEWIDTIEDQTNWKVCDSFESVADVEGSRRDSIFHYMIETFYSHTHFILDRRI